MLSYLRAGCLAVSWLLYGCGPKYGLNNPEEAWIPEELPRLQEYVMVEYQIKPGNGLARLTIGEAGFRWKVLVRLQGGEINEFWAYRIRIHGELSAKLYAPIPRTMAQLVNAQARIILVSHDQSDIFAHVYTTDGTEYPQQVNGDFNWEIADEIKPGEYIRLVTPDSQADWRVKEEILNQIPAVIKGMSPALKIKVERYLKARRNGYLSFSLFKSLELAAQYFTGVIFSGDWLRPLYSLSMFQSIWLLNFLTAPDANNSPEFYGAFLNNRQFALVLSEFQENIYRMIGGLAQNQRSLQYQLNDLSVQCQRRSPVEMIRARQLASPRR